MMDDLIRIAANAMEDDDHVAMLNAADLHALLTALAGSQFGVTRAFRFQKTFTDLAAAGLTNDVELFSLSAGWKVGNVKIKMHRAYEGTLKQICIIRLGDGNWYADAPLRQRVTTPSLVCDGFSEDA